MYFMNTKKNQPFSFLCLDLGIGCHDPVKIESSPQRTIAPTTCMIHFASSVQLALLCTAVANDEMGIRVGQNHGQEAKICVIKSMCS